MPAARIKHLIALGIILLTTAMLLRADDDSTPVKLSDLPAPAQTAIQTRTAGATLGPIDETKEDLEVVYEVEMTRGGQDRDFTVDQDGLLMDWQMFLPETPP